MSNFIAVFSLLLMGAFIGTILVFAVPVCLKLNKAYKGLLKLSVKVLPICCSFYLIIAAIAVFASFKDLVWGEEAFPKWMGWFFMVGLISPFILLGIDARSWKENSCDQDDERGSNGVDEKSKDS